jgi:hypothetical protein
MKKLSWNMVDAVIANDVALIAQLLDAGHDVNSRNENGETAFSYACAYDALTLRSCFTLAEQISTRLTKETVLRLIGRGQGRRESSTRGWRASVGSRTTYGPHRRVTHAALILRRNLWHVPPQITIGVCTWLRVKNMGTRYSGTGFQRTPLAFGRG